jgi:hypothetical protein
VRQIEKKGLRESEIVVESALFVRVATKGLRGIFVRPKGCGDAGRLIGSGELTAKVEITILVTGSQGELAGRFLIPGGRLRSNPNPQPLKNQSPKDARRVLVQPEMKSWRSPLASVPPFSAGSLGGHLSMQ